MEHIQQHIEALIFASEQSITSAEIVACLSSVAGTDIAEKAVDEAIETISQKYEGEEHFFELIALSGGYQFMTKKRFAPTVSSLIQHRNKKKLSAAAMETLAIIAYKQPITKTEIEQIRGVNCDYSVQKLLEKELITIEGKSDAPGRPLLYATSKLFMDYFSLNSLNDLPQLKDIQTTNENEIGEQTEN
ncbi:SMC-Scp complex subunit ScpB [Solitalea canadensis]|uniref:Segregation and condensation protein B n=1 Tax=Solitalea canadensis (strain ATCC 29591 / DSM 3403 / JCM 21819 / LMG 8368 / NBRC 15130 / NCIMB 12057 / USAM 9D) TaxID=929556 RepID=H8KRJ3_SOLCM|nr:SMC-Scp complex subunit ScpB [Solitalea canadensis]AFD07518.1 segregation and condensation protein B [Solitalea canadensis DSM 3403]